MSFFKNKHVITAMIVAPILAVLAYVAVDLVVQEKPHVALSGQAYPLIAKSNCRFSSGKCNLENATFKSQLSVQNQQGEKAVLELIASHSLQSATIGFVDSNGVEFAPTTMQATDNTGSVWQFELPVGVSSDALARLVLQANDVFYYAQTSMQFSTYQTSFDKDFRKKH